MILEYNLQFFAKDGPGGEKTEPATQKKLNDARKEGQVAKSREIANGLGLLALFLVLKLWVGNMGNSFLESFSSIYNRIPQVTKLLGGASPSRDTRVLFNYAIGKVLIIILPILLVGFAVAFLSDLVQVKWRPTSKPLRPKLSKLNPINGFKKLFSVNSLIELLKSIAKILLVGYIAYSFLQEYFKYIFILYDITIMQAVIFLGQIVTDMGMRISGFYMVLAIADLFYQRYKFKEDMKMTKQEVKDEYKNQEGDPQIKSKIRQKMREASQRRMMQALPQADVVITNPTHYAVAIQYDSSKYAAPMVLAKGTDFLALRIKEIARENKVEIVENKALARMLYANVEVGELIPPELYQAVAEVLAFVYHLQGKV
ncbi:MAG: flagellar biosynthesis protein FlhB [Lachnospiraceae bacterium]